MKLTCPTCGEIPFVTVDGYWFGDRLLEGVLFKVEDKDGKPHALGVTRQSRAYFEDLNEAKWLKACEDFCLNEDVAYCPNCEDEVSIWGDEATPMPIKQIQMFKGTDIDKEAK